MRSLRRFVIRIGNTIARRQYEERLKEELEEHLALQTAENLRAGLSQHEARRQAALKFGCIEAIKEDHREERAIMFISTFLQDIRYGFRNMRKSPGFTSVALLTLALGIGANAVIFSAINGILIEHLPYANASRLLTIQREQIAWGITPTELRTIQQQCPAFERMAFFDGLDWTVTIGDGPPISRKNSEVSGDFFPILGVKPLLGRYILPQDAEPGRQRVAVLSYSLWMDGFGGDQGVVGRDIMVGKNYYSVIGVMPKKFELGVEWGDNDEGLWAPMVNVSPKQRISEVIGLVKKGVALSVAQTQIRTVSPRLPNRFPPNEKHTEVYAERPKRFIDSKLRNALLILQGAVAFVLLMASVNLSALLVSRAWSRHRDLAIRKALGASRWRIFRQLLSESLLLALAGGALGLLLSILGIHGLRAIAPPGTPRLDRMQLDVNVLGFTLAVSLLSTILFGLLPALQASANRAGDIVRGGLNAMFTTHAARRRHFLRSGLLIAEVGLAAVLVIGGALMVRSFDKLMRVDTGVRSDHVLTMQVELSESMCKPTCRLAAENVLEGVRALPGVERAALSSRGPLGGGWDFRQGILIEGSPNEQPFDGVGRDASPDFFRTAGIRLLAGREFVAGDSYDVAIVSEDFARKYIIGNPLGKRFSPYKDSKGQRKWLEIVGEVKDTRNRAVTQFASGPPYYTHFSTDNSHWQVMARTSADPLSMAAGLQRVVRSVDKSAIITDVKTLDQLLSESAALPRFQTAIFGLFGVLALVLAVIGIYGVTSYSVVQRTHEIGIRMALGARAGDVARRIVVEGGALALVGIALGLAAALALVQFLEKMLFGIPPVDPPTFVAVATLLLLAALAACYFPARSATQVDPLSALRHE